MKSTGQGDKDMAEEVGLKH